MIDYYFAAPDQASFEAALPAMLKDNDGLPLDEGPHHAMLRDIFIPGDSRYLVILRILDNELDPQVVSGLGDFIVAEPNPAWVVFAS